jgi:hypothetical protein
MPLVHVFAVPIVHGAWWAHQPIWTLLEREKCLGQAKK